jgi:hypothetical protein
MEQRLRWPGIAGLLIDVGIDLDSQSFGCAAYCFGGAASFQALRSKFRRRVADTASQVTNPGSSFPPPVYRSNGSVGGRSRSGRFLHGWLAW